LAATFFVNLRDACVLTFRLLDAQVLPVLRAALPSGQLVWKSSNLKTGGYECRGHLHSARPDKDPLWRAGNAAVDDFNDAAWNAVQEVGYLQLARSTPKRSVKNCLALKPVEHAHLHENQTVPDTHPLCSTHLRRCGQIHLRY
jgi:hypothetical protein